MNMRSLNLVAVPVAAIGIAASATAWDGSASDARSDSGSAELGGHRECSPAVERRNLDVIETWIENLGVDPTANEALRAPDMTVTTPDALPYGGTRSDDEYRDLSMQYWARNPDAERVEPTLTPSCDQVILQGRFSPIAAETGVAVDVALVEVFTLEDGLVVNDTLFYFDTNVLLDALGLDVAHDESTQHGSAQEGSASAAEPGSRPVEPSTETTSRHPRLRYV